MMFIIADKNPERAVEYLVSHTSKVFYFKQLIELAQLVCSAGFSDIYKPVARGREIQEWIKQNKWYTYKYMRTLWIYVVANTKATPTTLLKLYKITNSLFDSLNSGDINKRIKTGIFRYKKGYESEYKTNSELPIKQLCWEYRKYIENFKFPKEAKV